MNVRFQPPQLKAARHANRLCELATEMSPGEAIKELRVEHQFPFVETRLVAVPATSAAVSVQLPGNWLYGNLTDGELRRPLTALLRLAAV